MSRIGVKVVSSAVFLFLCACGGSGGSGATSVTLPGDPAAPYSSLDAEQQQAACEDYMQAGASIGKQNKKATCMSVALIAAGFMTGLGDAEMSLSEACEGFYDQCMNEAAPALDTSTECVNAAQDGADCDASIEMVQTCFNDLLKQTDQMYKEMGSLTCNDVSASSPSSLAEPPEVELTEACQSVQSECPQLMPASSETLE